MQRQVNNAMDYSIEQDQHDEDRMKLEADIMGESVSSVQQEYERMKREQVHARAESVSRHQRDFEEMKREDANASAESIKRHQREYEKMKRELLTNSAEVEAFDTSMLDISSSLTEEEDELEN